MDGTGFNYFENTGYRNERKRMHSVYLKNDTNSHSQSNAFECHLIEPLRIDKVSEVFLDYFLTYEIGVIMGNGNIHKQAFVMDVEEFSIQSKSNNTHLHAKMVIPNDDTTGTGARVHKGRKMNYVATINPGVYHKFSGTITDLVGDPMFGSSAGTKISFTGNPASGTVTVVAHTKGETYTGTVTVSSSANSEGNILGGGVYKSSANAKTDSDIGTTINNIVARFKYMFQEDPGISFKKDGNSIIVTGLHGGSITSSSLLDASGGDVDGDTESPHFTAEFVIVEKD
jgi:hypothetical protein